MSGTSGPLLLISQELMKEENSARAAGGVVMEGYSERGKSDPVKRGET